MGVIVNPRGIAGSGKTELVRRILTAYGRSPEELAMADPAIPGGRRILHLLPHLAAGRALALLGVYRGGRAGSGCDGVRERDGGLAEVLRLAGKAADAGHDVLLEGLALSWEHRWSTALARTHRVHVIRLATPREEVLRNLLARRRAGRGALPQTTAAAAMQEEALDAALACLAPVAFIETLGFNDALRRTMELLGLGPTTMPSASARGEQRCEAI